MHYYNVDVIVEFDIDLDTELKDQVESESMSELRSEFERRVEKAFDSCPDVIFGDVADWGRDDDDNDIMYLWVSSEIESKDELTSKISAVLNSINSISRNDELWDGTYYTERHGFDYPPYEQLASMRDYSYEVYMDCDIVTIEETDDEGTPLSEAVNKNELKDRAEEHSKHQDGLSPFCSLGESGYKSGDRYYGGLPAEPEYEGPGKRSRYWKELIQYFNDAVKDYPEYDVIGTSPVAVTLKTPNGKETIDLTKFDALADADEAIEMASHYFDASLFESKELTEGIWAYQTIIRPIPGEKQPTKILTYGGNFVMSRSPYRVEEFSSDWKRHISKIIEWTSENDPGLHRITHEYRIHNFGKDCNSEEAYIAAIEHLISNGECILINEHVDKFTNESKKKKKPFDSINTNAGNVEHNIGMFNKMSSPVEGPNNNPVSGPFGGDVSVGCCEDLDDVENTEKVFMEEYDFTNIDTNYAKEVGMNDYFELMNKEDNK